jgi:uncharacterized protein YjbI with pentapeptide repeats
MTKRENYIQKKFNSKEELTSFIIDGLENNEYSSRKVMMNNFSFDFEIIIPFNLMNVKVVHSNFLNNCQYSFVNCSFYNDVLIKNSTKELNFTFTNFDKLVRIDNITTNLTFRDCNIVNLDISESKIGSKGSDLGKLRVKSCDVYKTNFKNTTFHALVDFYYTSFHENVIFYRTDFLNIVVLSATKFKKNLLFTYTLLNDKVIMRSTIFEKGYDFSLAIIKGQLAIFDLNHTYNSYLSKDGLVNEKEYEKAVSFQGIIPTQNKLETYRLLKVEFEKQQNIAESLNFKVFEKKTFKKTLENKKNTWQNSFDQVSLWLNRVSNNHGTSYLNSLIFVLVVGGFFFYLSLISTDSFEFTPFPCQWDLEVGFKYYIQFLIPTHKFNYMGDNIKLTSCFYVFDFLGRLFVGYGIYQFIQAFRKFK